MSSRKQRSRRHRAEPRPRFKGIERLGYDLHITRRSDWADEGTSRAIPVEEWLRVAQADPSLHNVADNGSAFFELAGSSGWFDYSEGCVFTKNPGKAAIDKAHVIAALLRAKVQGDDGEVYLPNGETVGNDVQVVTQYPLWLLALCLLAMGCFIVLLIHTLAGL